MFERTRTVRAWMSPALLLDPRTSAAEARDALDEHATAHACVVRDGQLVGIVSDRDLPRLEEDQDDVGTVMTEAPLTVSPETALEAAARVMLEEDVHALPVVSGAKVLGVLSDRDLVRALLASLAEERAREEQRASSI